MRISRSQAKKMARKLARAGVKHEEIAKHLFEAGYASSYGTKKGAVISLATVSALVGKRRQGPTVLRTKAVSVPRTQKAIVQAVQKILDLDMPADERIALVQLILQ